METDPCDLICVDWNEIGTDEWLDCGCLEEYDVFEDGMDGDHDSAMTSIGWGTDEDYGFYGGEE